MNAIRNPSKNVRVFLIALYGLVSMGPFMLMTMDAVDNPNTLENMTGMDFFYEYQLPFIAGQLFLLIYFVAISDWKKLLCTRFSKLDELEKNVLYKIVFMSYGFFVGVTILNLIFYTGSGTIVEQELSRMIPLGELVTFIVVPILVGFYYDDQLVD